MAKIKLGALVTDLSGKIGGQQIGRNRNTLILKNKSVSNKNGKPKQQLARSQTEYLMLQWSLLDDDQRRQWYLQIESYRSFNIFGDRQKYNGFSLFQKLNQGRLKSGQSLLLTPNAVSTPPPPQFLTISASSTSIEILNTNFDASTICQIYASPPVTKGTSNPTKRMRFIGNVAGNVLASGIDVTSLYTSVFGSLIEDSNIYLGMKTTSLNSGYSNNTLLITKPYATLSGSLPTYVSTSAQVNASNNDAEELRNSPLGPSYVGSMQITSPDLELNADTDGGVYHQMDAWRFTGLNIPSNAIITNAYIQFTSTQSDSSVFTLWIHAQKGPNPAVFTTTKFNISSRPRTTAYVNWIPPTWSGANLSGADQQTPDIKTVIQEVIQDSNYNSSDALVLIIFGDDITSGRRNTWSYNGDSTKAAVLHIDYYYYP